MRDPPITGTEPGGMRKQATALLSEGVRVRQVLLREAVHEYLSMSTAVRHQKNITSADHEAPLTSFGNKGSGRRDFGDEQSMKEEDGNYCLEQATPMHLLGRRDVMYQLAIL